MIRITITHVVTSPDGSTTTTIEDEYLGLIEDLADRLRKCRAALDVPDQAEPDDGPDLDRRIAELVAPEPVPSTLIDSRRAGTPYIASTAPRPIVEPWTGTRFYAWAKRKAGALEFVQSFGAAHGYPRRILEWSTLMCNQAHAAWQAERSAVA